MNAATPDFTISTRRHNDDEERFGLVANPDGSVDVPITDPTKYSRTPQLPGTTTQNRT